MRPLGSISALTAAAIWGGMYVVSKVVLDYIPPITLVALRLIIAVLVLGSVFVLRRFPFPDRRQVPRLALTGFVGFGLSLVAQFIGTKLSTAANGALVTSASPAFIVLFAYLLLGEPFTLRKVLGLALATVGVAVVIDPRQVVLSSQTFWGNVWLIAAAITWALYSVLVKAAARQQPVLTVSLYAIFFGWISTSPLVPWELSHTPLVPISWPIVLGVLYLGVISTAVAMYLWNKGFEQLEAGVAAIFFFAQPVVGGFLGWLLLGEQLGWDFFAGGALIFAAVLVVSWD